MICRHCGKNIPEEAVFCPFCDELTESHLRREKTESHLRKEDRLQEEMERDKPKTKKEKKKKEKYIEEPAGKRRLKSFISIIAAFVFVAAAFIAIMVFVKPYLGEEPWPDEDDQAIETEEISGLPKNMYITAEEGVILQKEPGPDGKAIHLLNYGCEIEVEKAQDGWAYATVDGLSGWFPTEYLTEDTEEILQKDIKPGSAEDKGQLVEPAKIIRNGYHGTVNAEDGLNLRCGPDPDYDILLVIPYKTEVIEEGWHAGWIYVRYDGQYGWINAEFITPTGEVEGASQ